MEKNIRFILILLVFANVLLCHQNYSSDFSDDLKNIKGVTIDKSLKDSEMEELSNELRRSREDKDHEKETLLISRLRLVYGETKTDGNSDVTVIPGEMNNDNIVKNNYSSLFNSYLDGPAVKNIATQTSSRSNTIYTATTKFHNSNYDILSVFASYDDCLTWTLKGYSYLSARFKQGELDIEPVISGSDTVLFCSAGYSIGKHSFVAFFKFNISTGVQSYNMWSHWGSANTNVNVYNPRVTSDNSIYDGAYIYISVAVDSIRADGNKNVFQRSAIIFNPFENALSITYRNNLSFYWYGTTSGSSIYYLWQDICYYRLQNGTDRIYTVYNIPEYNSIYTAYSDNYGLSPAAHFFLSDGVKIDQANVVSSGGYSNQNIAIAYRVLTSNLNNYDFKCMYSTNGGTSALGFNNTYIEGSNSISTKYIDVQSIKLSAGKCKFTYSTSNDLNIYYLGNVNNSSYEPVTSFAADPLFGITNYGKLRAAYTNRLNTAGCMVLYSSDFSNSALCVTGFCSQQNKTNYVKEPEGFLLENYPNPFNPTTTIKYSVPADSKVKITVYDLLGKEISVLVDENLKTGKYEVNFDASALASGTYFYSLEAGAHKEIKKMILIK
jgi:hypothetical protein